MHLRFQTDINNSQQGIWALPETPQPSLAFLSSAQCSFGWSSRELWWGGSVQRIYI